MFPLVSTPQGLYLGSVDSATYTLVPGSANAPDYTLPPHLRQPVLVIDLVLSGTGRPPNAPDLYPQLLQPLFAAVGVVHHYIRTELKTHIADIAASLSSRGASITVVFLSGDTLVHELINHLDATLAGAVTLVLVPTGTGNALLRLVGHMDVWAALQALFQPLTPKPLPVYRVDFPEGSTVVHSGVPVRLLYFLVVVLWCFHALLVADSETPEMRKLGMQRFQVAARENLQRDQCYHGLFSVTGGPSATARTVAGPLSYLVVTPVKRFEPTFDILPAGNVFTPDAHAVVMPHVLGSDLVEVMTKAYAKGAHVDDPRVEYLHLDGALTARIVLDEADAHQRRVCVDGEIVACGRGSVEVAYAGTCVNGWDVRLLA